MSSMAAYKAKLNRYVEGRDFLEMQREMPQLLADLVADVPPERLSESPSPGKWSVLEILAHLAEDELTSSWRYRQMIENPGVALAGFDQDLGAKIGHYREWTAAEALSMFRLLREANLRMFANLTPEQWECHGVHAERGAMTVRELARHMAGHDRNHLEQIQRIMD
jgi:uncharacterized damage-inducible protein DinB